MQSGSPSPMPLLPRVSDVPASTDIPAWLAALKEAYRKGRVRDEDLLLDPSYAPLRQQFALIDVLRTPRAFS
jgi:hypothetical protein